MFLLLYALAWAGGAIAYTPLLTLLLPVRVAEQAGEAAGVDWLALIALVGAFAASVGGILFGYLSDISRNRRAWIAAGLVLSSLLLPVIGRAEGLGPLVMAIIAWQLALNMMLGPLAAWAGDHVPDDAKGLLGGLIAMAPVMGALAGVIVTHPALPATADRFLLVGLLVGICVLPALVRTPAAPVTVGSDPQARPAFGGWRAGVLPAMWLARLAVQVAEATLFTYLYFWLRSLDPDVGSHQAARLFGMVMLGSVPLALGAGRWSDRTGRPILPIGLCALAAAIGLAGMAVSSRIPMAMAAYTLFGLASAVFLALHAAQTLRILPSASRRGRDLGLFNLANTVPSLVMPPLAVSIVPSFGYGGLFACLAVLAAAAAMLLLTQSRRS
jgi:MFS family permease